jgi:recombinational DNA repair protein RecR
MDNPYKWSLSIVKNYLNNEFINELSDDTRSKLVPKLICDVYEDTGCDEDKGCGGYLKEDIEKSKYECEKYSSSLIRVITYEEYNDIYNNIEDMKDFVGNYWILNAYGKNVASTVEEKGNVFILEKPTNKKQVRPVITITK